TLLPVSRRLVLHPVPAASQPARHGAAPATTAAAPARATA
ncbi:MAG: hypothetical protein RJA36_2858, partial [Pseudomonadota bacterium]